MNARTMIIEAAGVADGCGFSRAPGAVLFRRRREATAGEILAVGRGEEVRSHPAAQMAEQVSLPDSVVLPALVNAHTHLDLTAVGPLPIEPEVRGFVGWIERVRSARPTEADAIAESVQQGVERSLAGGVAAVGDIAGAWSTVPVELLRRSPLIGVSFVECFGLGARATEAGDRLERLVSEMDLDADGVRLGVQPHAPYSAGPALHRRAAGLRDRLGIPVATHLGESVEERELLTHGAGPLRTLLERLGLWNKSTAAAFGGARSPIDWLREILARSPILLAHVNDADDRDIEILAESCASVVYCPRAAAHLGHERALGPHRYREMIEAGVSVALGTDSAAGLPRRGEQTPSLSLLEEMRLLRWRDTADPTMLLAMATRCGAEVLGLEPVSFDLSPGPVAGLIEVDVAGSTPTLGPIERVLSAHTPPHFL